MPHARAQGIRHIWPEGAPIVGMIHLMPLPGSPGWGGSMDEVLERALADAETLTAGGLDGLLVENYGDVPFFPRGVPPETAAAMGSVVARVVASTSLPVGVNVLRNDGRTALGVAAAAGARFIRVNVLAGSMWTDQGLLEGSAADLIRVRASLAPEVAVLADVHVKHATPPAASVLEDAAADLWERALADALIVSGAATGAPTDPGRVRDVKASVPDAPVFVGSGVRPESAMDLRAVADGLIVGSALNHEGRAGRGIDPDAVARFMEAARGG